MTNSNDCPCKKARPWHHPVVLLCVGLLWLILLVSPAAGAETALAQKSPEQIALEKQAQNSLRQLKRVMAKEGFYIARISLNVWKSTALEAGTFDPQLYEELKLEIYQKSMRENLIWFEKFLEVEDYSDAQTCLQIWRIHASEIGQFDPAMYEALKKRLTPKN